MRKISKKTRKIIAVIFLVIGLLFITVPVNIMGFELFLNGAINLITAMATVICWMLALYFWGVFDLFQ